MVEMKCRRPQQWAVSSFATLLCQWNWRSVRSYMISISGYTGQIVIFSERFSDSQTILGLKHVHIKNFATCNSSVFNRLLFVALWVELL